MAAVAADLHVHWSWNSTGPTPTRTPTPTPTLGMRLSCNFVNVYTIAYRLQYTFTRVHARTSSWGCSQGKVRVSDKSADKSERIVVCVRLLASWTDMPTSSRRSSRGSRQKCPCRCRCPCVGPMEFKLNSREDSPTSYTNLVSFGLVTLEFMWL